MSNADEDFSSSIHSNDRSKRTFELESSLDSYPTIFNRDINNFTTSSEVEENRLSTETFVKETSTTIINAFTGKPISPNPWGKLCTKPVSDLIPTQLFSPNRTKVVTPQRPKSIRSSRRDEIHDQVFEPSNSIQIDQQNTPLQRRRKKRNSLKDTINDSSTSSDERVKEQPVDLPPKTTNRLIDNDLLWHRLRDVYTSDSSDENNLLQHSNTSHHSIHLKSEANPSDEPTSSPTKENPPPVLNFLESLSNRVPLGNKHPDAKSYFFPSGFNSKEKRQELADRLLSIFNKDVFSSRLSDKVSVVWSGRLTATAGHCTSRKNTRTAVITLSQKVCDSPERCRDTLLHEMCHAAVTLIDSVMEQGHGTLWRKWTRIAEQCYPYLPPISVRHTYDVVYKFIYRCVQCEYEVYRHSKSLDIAIDYCGKCLGQFVLIVNDDKDGGNEQDRTTPKKTMNKYNVFVKENFQVVKNANPHLSTPQIMKELSEVYKKKNQQQHIELPDFEQLKI